MKLEYTIPVNRDEYKTYLIKQANESFNKNAWAFMKDFLVSYGTWDKFEKELKRYFIGDLKRYGKDSPFQIMTLDEYVSTLELVRVDRWIINYFYTEYFTSEEWNNQQEAYIEALIEKGFMFNDFYEADSERNPKVFIDSDLVIAMEQFNRGE